MLLHLKDSTFLHYIDVIMGAMASQTTSLTSVYSIAYSGADQTKHQSSATMTGEFPTQMASNAENVSIWWRHHEQCRFSQHEHQTHLPNWRWYYSGSENNIKASLDTTGTSCHRSFLHNSFCLIIISHFLINSRDLCTNIHLYYCQGIKSSITRLFVQQLV